MIRLQQYSFIKMEELPLARVPVPRHNTGVNRCITFENEIEKVELRREELVGQILRNKRQIKENCKFYISKKQIIPSTFQCSSCHHPASMKIFNARLQKRRNQIYSEHQNSSHASNDKQDVGQKISSNRNLNEDRQLQKWKIEINSEELNSLFFGKQLKIGLKYRQKYISDDKIRQMKTNILRSKSNQNTIYHSKQQIERGKFREVELLREKNTAKSQSHLLTKILHLNSLKKSRKYYPLRNLLINQQSEPVREIRKNNRYLKREFA